jgi:Fe-S cluster assembly protein SufB
VRGGSLARLGAAGADEVAQPEQVALPGAVAVLPVRRGQAPDLRQQLVGVSRAPVLERDVSCQTLLHAAAPYYRGSRADHGSRVPAAARSGGPAGGIVRAAGYCYYLRSGNPPATGPAPDPRSSFMAVKGIDLGKYQLGWSDTENYVYKPKKGVNEQVVKDISWHKSEPEWMTTWRLNALKRFERKPMLEWFAKNMPDIDFDDIYYYIKPTEGVVNDWDMLPDEMKATYEKLGIPEAERKFLAGVTSQYESEVVYHKNRDDLAEKGILFTSMDQALIDYPDLVKEHLGTVIPPGDNKFAALNSAVWSGGSFIYVPPGVHVDMPLQAYFRINAENAGQFERTLIIADEGSSVHYVEGCSAPVYSSDSLHSAVVELIAKPSARIRYTTIQNWSSNVYNLVTKRARAETEATVEWIDGNLGSKLTMKYPAVVMTGPKAHGEVLSVAYAGPGQHQDAGAKMTHAAPETTSIIDSKSISKDGGRTTYRGLVKVNEGAHGVKSHVRCDALILDEESRSDTYPYMEIDEKDARIGHEATVSKVGDDQLFYLMSRGLSEQQAVAMIVNGFIEPITKTLPMEYAVELSRLIELNMEGAVG